MKLKDFFRRIEISFWVFAVALMKDKKSTRFTLILLLMGLFFGVIVFFTACRAYAEMNDDRAYRSSPELTDRVGRKEHRPEQEVSKQRNILLVLVDDLAEEIPNLEGVWLVVYLPPDPRLTFLPIFPAFPIQQETLDSSLVKLFGLSQHGKLAPSFLEAIKAKDFWWDENLVFDRVSLAVLIELAGGMDTGQGLVNGTQVIDQLPETWKDPRGAMEHQVLIASGICQNLGTLLTNPDTARLLELLSGRTYSQSDFLEHFPGWSYLLEYGGTFSCEFPTLNGISSLIPSD